jgi:succinate-semialdehyde dehydrogenase / glutarate-semialdehyde dehydrogenase
MPWSEAMIETRNPATGELVRSFEAMDDTAVEAALMRTERAFTTYRRTGFAERAVWLARAGDLLEAEKREHARLITLEMGKPLSAAVAEVEKCAWVCHYYAEHGAGFLASEPVDVDGDRAWVEYQPLGAVLAVMPWNFPYWQVFRFAAPALMAGNAGLLKHASNVPQCALAIENVLRRAGFAEGVFQALLVGTERVAGLIEDARVQAVTLTGSEGAGRAVGAAAGRALKPSVLELGGSDPLLVLPSADLDAAVETAVAARTVNTGQSCIAAKRFIVHSDVYPEFERRFANAMAALPLGDPMDEGVRLGPLATRAIRDEVHEQVQCSVAAGARLLTGGEVPERSGWYYPPTVLAEIPPHAPAYREEVFGPVALLFRAADVGAAIRLANDSPFGLGASVWTRDAAEQRRCIEELDVGQVFVNAMVASDPRLPFGGVKASGYGRELGAHGIREFVNAKTVRIAG